MKTSYEFIQFRGTSQKVMLAIQKLKRLVLQSLLSTWANFCCFSSTYVVTTTVYLAQLALSYNALSVLRCYPYFFVFVLTCVCSKTFASSLLLDGFPFWQDFLWIHKGFGIGCLLPLLFENNGYVICFISLVTLHPRHCYQISFFQLS